MPRVAGAGEVEKKTIVTEILPAKDSRANGGDVRNPDCFDFMEELSSEDWKNHIVYIYRLEPQIFRQKEGDPAYVGCVSQAITRQYIFENYGGGVFEIWVKQGRQIMSRHSYTIAGAPKNLDSNAQPAAATPGGVSIPADTGASMGMRALEMMGGPQTQVFAAMLDMVKAASAEQIALIRAAIPPQKDPVETLLASIRLMKELNPAPPVPAAPAPNLMDELLRPMLAAMIQKMTNPANPLEEFKTMAGVMKEIGGLGGGEKSNLAADVVRALPGALREATGMVREIRLSNEAAVRAAPMPVPGAPARNPSAPPNVVTMPSPAAVDSGQGPIEVHPPDPNWIKLRVVQMISEPETQPGDVAEWLRDTAPEFLHSLSAATPEQILGYFRTDPVLQHAAGNPRLAQFVRDLVSYLHDVPTTAENAAPQKPPA